MSDFKLLFPDIPARANLMQSNRSYTTESPLYNTILGARQEMARVDSKQTTVRLDYDLGSGVTQVVDFILVARANIIVNNDTGTPQVKLYSNTSFTTAGAVTITNNLTSSNLVGRRLEDAVYSINQAQDYRCFFVEFIGSISQWFELGKVWLGRAFDFDRNPNPLIIDDYKEDPNHLINARQFKLTFEGITTTKKNEFIDKIAKYKDVMPVYLWDNSNLFFNGEKLMAVKILSTKFSHNIRESWKAELSFEELI